jgi:hypothetical protein
VVLFLPSSVAFLPQALAEDGALLLGERLRSPEERRVVVDVLAKTMGVQVGGLGADGWLRSGWVVSWCECGGQTGQGKVQADCG